MSKCLIITGGSRGIGEKTIAQFLKDGWETINLSRTPNNNPAVKNYSLDLTNFREEDLAAAGQAIVGRSKICLVHNAAFYKRDCIPDLSLNDLNLTLQTNIIGPIALNKFFIPHMAPGSSIIYIGSTLSDKAVPGSASYTVSKHALIGLMKATCQDLIKQRIRSCCVCPGLVDTQLLKDTMEPETIDYLLSNHIIGKRLINPEEIASIIHFIANTETINGATIHANLGQVAD